MHPVGQLFLTCMAGLALLGACRKGADQEVSGGAHTITVVCVACDAPGSINTHSPAAEEEWPKQCPSCKRTGAYPSGTCGSCGKQVAFMHPRDRSYEVPAGCPYCGKKWQTAGGSADARRQ
jgi:DnaJ-class molecular chaperone